MPSTVILLSLNWEAPWNFLKTLFFWLDLVSERLDILEQNGLLEKTVKEGLNWKASIQKGKDRGGWYLLKFLIGVG